jgi:hypothetical protein
MHDRLHLCIKVKLSCLISKTATPTASVNLRAILGKPRIMPWRVAPKGIVFPELLIMRALSLYTVNVNTRADTVLCPLSAPMGVTDHAKNQLVKLVLVVWCLCEKKERSRGGARR